MALRVVGAALFIAAALCFAHPAHAQGHDSEKEEVGRLRIGFNANAGFATGRQRSGPVVGSSLRVGWQLDRDSAFYGQVSPLLWKPKKDWLLGGQLALLYSRSLTDVVELAAGPSVDAAADKARPIQGLNFGFHFRGALHFGGRDEETGRRRGFSFGVDVHPTIVEGGWITFTTLGLGYDWY